MRLRLQALFFVLSFSYSDDEKKRTSYENEKNKKDCYSNRIHYRRRPGVLQRRDAKRHEEYLKANEKYMLLKRKIVDGPEEWVYCETEEDFQVFKKNWLTSLKNSEFPRIAMDFAEFSGPDWYHPAWKVRGYDSRATVESLSDRINEFAKFLQLFSEDFSVVAWVDVGSIHKVSLPDDEKARAAIISDIIENQYYFALEDLHRAFPLLSDGTKFEASRKEWTKIMEEAYPGENLKEKPKHVPEINDWVLSPYAKFLRK